MSKVKKYTIITYGEPSEEALRRFAKELLRIYHEYYKKDKDNIKS